MTPPLTIHPNGSQVIRFASAVWTVPAATGIKEVRRVERDLLSCPQVMAR